LNLLNTVACLSQADRFDIIHNHTGEGMATAPLIKTPMLTTLHGHLDEDWRLAFSRYRGWYNTISRSAKALLPAHEGFAGVVYNAIEVQSYPFNGGHREPHLLFLSRMSPEKGPHLAIEVARRLGCKLVLAGNVDAVDEAFFKAVVFPQVDGDQIRYVGEADYHRKRELLAQAYCLLAPLTWAEPFGLFLAEAMACGTPVIAFGRGAAPEVVQHGETGLIVHSLAEMAAAVSRVPTIDPHRCRAHVERHFDVSLLTDRYLATYEVVLTHAASEKALGAAAPSTTRARRVPDAAAAVR
jgi:glycosyltransferase involved in cell wall biosynthesis